jgi:sec-independent protein translocase protein TatC
MKRPRRTKAQTSKKPRIPEQQRLPFIEHLYELRKRLVYIATSIAVFSVLAYTVNRSVIRLLLRPAGSQKFIYTSPIGGIDFLFRVCLYIGIAASIPVIVYQFLKYLEPLFKRSSLHFITWGSIISGVLALAGILFGYFIGLPATLHFLLHQFFTKQIQPLLTIQSYMAFVTMYMLGSALLFQVPLILVFINRIKPLNPKKLRSMKYERWVILCAFIGGGLMNPNPNLIDQLVIVGPLILMYQVGVAIIWLGQRKHQKPAYVTGLLQQDSELQAMRLERFRTAQHAWEQMVAQRTLQPATSAAAVHKNNIPVVTKPVQRPSRPVTRSRTYVNDVQPNRSYRSVNRRLPGIA